MKVEKMVICNVYGKDSIVVSITFCSLYIKLIFWKEENRMRVQPTYSDAVELEIKGYGCDDDCQQWFEKTVKLNCGWKDTDNTCPIW